MEDYTEGTYSESSGNHYDVVKELEAYVYVVKEADVRYQKISVPQNEERNLILCDGAKLTSFVYKNSI